MATFFSLPLLLLLLLSSDDVTSVVLLLRSPCFLAFSPFRRLAFLVVFFHAAIDHFKLALDACGSVSLLASLVFLSYNVRHFFLLLLFGLFVDAILREKFTIRYGEKNGFNVTPPVSQITLTLANNPSYKSHDKRCSTIESSKIRNLRNMH